MRTKKGFITIGLGLISLLHLNHSQAQSRPDLEEAKKAIAASNAIFHKTFLNNDSSTFINLYSEDACILAPDAPVSCGKGAIEKMFRGGYDAGIRSGKLVTTGIYGDGVEFVTEEGIGTIFDKNGTLIDEGKYLVVWKKTKLGWKMYRDIFSSNLSHK